MRYQRENSVFCTPVVNRGHFKQPHWSWNTWNRIWNDVRSLTTCCTFLSFKCIWPVLLWRQSSVYYSSQPLLCYFLLAWLADGGLLVLAATLAQSSWHCLELFRTHYLLSTSTLPQHHPLLSLSMTILSWQILSQFNCESEFLFPVYAAEGKQTYPNMRTHSQRLRQLRSAYCRFFLKRKSEVKGYKEPIMFIKIENITVKPFP